MKAAKDKTRLVNEPEVLDDATPQAIEEGLKSEKSGKPFTMDEAVQFAKERRKAWQTVPEFRS